MHVPLLREANKLLVLLTESGPVRAMEVRATRHVLSSERLTIDSFEGNAPRHQGREREREGWRVRREKGEKGDRERSDVETG